MIKKLFEFITNKRVFTAFYAGTIIYNFLVIRLILPDVYVFIRSQGFPLVYTIWAGIIVITDLFQKKLFENKTKLLWNITFLIALLSMVVQPKPRSIQQIRYLIVFGIEVYILVSAAGESKKEEMQSFFISLAKQTVIIISILNVLSLVIAAFLLLKQELPEWITHLNNGLLPEPTSHTISLLPNNFGRYKGLFISVPEAGFDCYVAMCLNLLLLDKKKISKLFGIFNIICCVLMIILTDARDVLINLVIIVLVLFARAMSNKIGKKKSLALSIFILCSICGFIAYKLYEIIIHLHLTTGEGLYSLVNRYSSSRLNYYRIGWNDFMQRKWIGQGWLNCDSLLGYTWKAETHPNYHNCIINLLAWTGIIGTGSFLVSLFYSVKKIFENRKLISEDRCKWLVVLCVCIFTQSLLDICLFGEDTHIESVYFWVCLGYLVYLNDANKRDLII